MPGILIPIGCSSDDHQVPAPSSGTEAKRGSRPGSKHEGENEQVEEEEAEADKAPLPGLTKRGPPSIIMNQVKAGGICKVQGLQRPKDAEQALLPRAGSACCKLRKAWDWPDPPA
jgi:hypothetical protein